jgi:hypothetical protein
MTFVVAILLAPGANAAHDNRRSTVPAFSHKEFLPLISPNSIRPTAEIQPKIFLGDGKKYEA